MPHTVIPGKPAQCSVDENCKLAPRNMCVQCGKYACDYHYDGLIPMCLLCVAVGIADVPPIDTPMKISLDDCMRLQRILERL